MLVHFFPLFHKHRFRDYRRLADNQHIGTVRYGSRINSIVNTIGKRLFSRSGQQLFRLDRDVNGRSLLSILADPGKYPLILYTFRFILGRGILADNRSYLFSGIETVSTDQNHSQRVGFLSFHFSSPLLLLLERHVDVK